MVKSVRVRSAGTALQSGPDTDGRETDSRRNRPISPARAFERDMQLVHTIPIGPERGNVTDLAFTPDGRHVVTANNNGTCYIFRLEPWPGGVACGATGVSPVLCRAPPAFRTGGTRRRRRRALVRRAEWSESVRSSASFSQRLRMFKDGALQDAKGEPGGVSPRIERCCATGSARAFASAG